MPLHPSALSVQQLRDFVQSCINKVDEKMNIVESQNEPGQIKSCSKSQMHSNDVNEHEGSQKQNSPKNNDSQALTFDQITKLNPRSSTTRKLRQQVLVRIDYETLVS